MIKTIFICEISFFYKNHNNICDKFLFNTNFFLLKNLVKTLKKLQKKKTIFRSNICLVSQKSFFLSLKFFKACVSKRERVLEVWVSVLSSSSLQYNTIQWFFCPLISWLLCLHLKPKLRSFAASQLITVNTSVENKTNRGSWCLILRFLTKKYASICSNDELRHISHHHYNQICNNKLLFIL